MLQKLDSSTLLQSPIASSRVDPTSTLLNLNFTIKSELAKLTNCCAQSLQRDYLFIYFSSSFLRGLAITFNLLRIPRFTVLHVISRTSYK